jgi:hypothetical protein
MTDQHGENPPEPLGEGADQPPSQPEAPATPPPSPPPAAPAAPSPPAGGGTSYDMADAKAALQGANQLDLGIMGAALVALIGSWLPFYTASLGGGGLHISGHISAWHGFFGWFAVLVALAVAVLVALPLFNVNLSLPMPLAQIALAGFGLALLCMILALFITPGGGCGGGGGLGISCDTGRGFGYWLALLAVLAGTALAFLRAKDTLMRTA